MTKIGEQTLLGVPPRKKRSWSTAAQSSSTDDSKNITDLMHHHDDEMMHHNSTNATINNGTTARRTIDPSTQLQVNLQSILERYHSLALAHYTQTKRRRIETSNRAAQNSARFAQITKLQRMATDTLDFCTKVLRNEEYYRKENERECNEVEMEMQRASREKALAEDFLSKVGLSTSTLSGRCSSSSNLHYSSRQLTNTKGMMEKNDTDNENVENGGGIEGGDYTIGGIPSRFLDLSHFPKLQQRRKGGGRGATVMKSMKHDPVAEDCKHHPIIDCTEEDNTAHYFASSLGQGGATRIPSFGVPSEVVALTTTNNNKMQKQNSKRIYITNASLLHVNGTYIQEGTYNDAPLFVRVGDPRKFWGKYDCSVVLRREKKTKAAGISTAPRGNGRANNTTKAEEYIWKIGLVPAHRITHPRIIGYFTASEDDVVPAATTMTANNTSSAVSTTLIDQMDEDFDDQDLIDPPAEGWRVCQQERSTAKGRATSLKVSYE